MRPIEILMLVGPFALLLQPASSQFADIQIEINPDPDSPTPTVNITNLQTAAKNVGINTGILNMMPQTVDTQLQAELCGPGTYSQMSTGQFINTNQCVKCPNGTASAVSGASDPSTCVPCPTGAYSWQGASACIDCAANTFSVTPQAPNSSACIACPPNTNALPGSDAIEKCQCNTAFFLSDNILTVNALTYDTIATAIPFGDVAPINTPHVTCSLL